MKYNGKNERIKREYLRYLKEAKRLDTTTTDAVAASLDRYENFTKRKDFAQFHIEQPIAFKRHLSDQLNPRTGKPLSKSTQLHIPKALHKFFFWLAGLPAYRRRIRYSDADYFSLSLKDTAIAKADGDVRGPTIEQVRHVLEQMPTGNDIERRNRALIALALLTGARASALASLRLKHLDLASSELTQTGCDVRTKASKTIYTTFLPVGDDIVWIVADWATFLQTERLWGPDDALFPATLMDKDGDGNFATAGLDRKCWRTSTPIRTIFKEAFAAAGLPYFNPHSFRHTLMRLGMAACKTPEEMKALSQNFGHSKAMVSLMSYGQIDRNRQRDIMRGLGSRKPEGVDEQAEAMAQRVAELIRKSQ
jgi:integrase